MSGADEKALESFFTNGRHLPLWSGCTEQQFVCAIDPKIRGNVDFTYTFNTEIDKTKLFREATNPKKPNLIPVKMPEIKKH